MSDEVKNAIMALQNGNSDEFRDSINDIMMSKAHDSIGLRRVSAGQEFFGDSSAEEEPADDILDTDEE